MPGIFSNSSDNTLYQALGVWVTSLVMPGWVVPDASVGTCDLHESDKLASAGLHMCHELDDVVFTPTQARSLCETRA